MAVEITPGKPKTGQTTIVTDGGVTTIVNDGETVIIN